MSDLNNRIKKLEELAEKLVITEHDLNIDISKSFEKELKYPFLETLFIFLDHLDTFTLITDRDDRVIYANKKLIDWVEKLGEKFDPKSNKRWWEQLGWDCNPSDKDLTTQECIQKRKVINHTIPSRLVKGLKYEVMCIPLRYNGVAAVLSLIRPVDKNG